MERRHTHNRNAIYSLWSHSTRIWHTKSTPRNRQTILPSSIPLIWGSLCTFISTKPVITYYVLYSIPLYLAFKRYDKLCKSKFERQGSNSHLSTSLTTTITASFSNWFNLPLIYNALTICIPSLICQEVVGHYFAGDIPSRSEGVLNAVIYAMYFSVSHLF